MSDQQEELQQIFSDAVLLEAMTIGESVSAYLLGRAEVNGIAITSPLTKVCDTAFWLEKTSNGGYILLISIVEIGSFITSQKTPALDNEAYARAFTHHTTEKVFVPLFPDCLAEGNLSFLEGQPCPALTLFLPFDATLHAEEPSIQHTVVNCRKLLTYEEGDMEMSDAQAELSSMLQTAVFLALELWKMRVLNGAIASYKIDTGWVTTEDGVRILLEEDKRFMSYIIVQEFMILANQTIASYLAERMQPALYRNHAVQVPLVKATYGPSIHGHGGLNVPVYIHATVPLRHYPDLVNQRILLAVLQGEPSPYTIIELETIAAHLNREEASIKSAKGEHFREEYDEKLQKMIKEESLASLHQKQFHSVIRKAAEEQTLALEIAQEIHRRLEHMLLKVNDLYTLVFRFQNIGEEWERIKLAIFQFLQKNPSYAAMLLNIGHQIGKWKVLGYDEPRNLLGHFQVKVSIQYEGQEYTSSFHTALQKEHAKQLAIVEVLANIAGVVLPFPEVSELESWEEAHQEVKTLMDFLKQRGGY